MAQTCTYFVTSISARKTGTWAFFLTLFSNQTPFFFLSDKCELTAGQTKKKHSAAPPGVEPGSSDCRTGALTTELRSHNNDSERISPSSQFFFRYEMTRMHVRAYKHVETNENSLDIIVTVQIENSFLSGPFHLIKLLSFFHPTNVN